MGRTPSILSDCTRKQILLDIERYPGKTCEEILTLEGRSYNREDTSALRNRFNYLKKQKKDHPSRYWTEFARCNANALNNTTPCQSPASSIATPPPHPRRPVPYILTPSPVKGTPKNTAQRNNRTTTMPPATRKKLLTRQDGDEEDFLSNANIMFRTFEEAEAAGKQVHVNSLDHVQIWAQQFSHFHYMMICWSLVDQVHFLDLESPDGHGAYGFWAQFTKDVRSKDETFLYDEFNMRLMGISIDVMDAPQYCGRIVLAGDALLITMPFFPSVYLTHYDDMHAVDKERKATVEDSFIIHANSIIEDTTRNTCKILFVLPDGYSFGCDFLDSDASPSPVDKTLKITLRHFEVSRSRPQASKGSNGWTQTFYHGFFKLRVHTRQMKTNRLAAPKTVVDDLDSFFTGMDINGMNF